MSWNHAKKTVIECLKEGRIQHELRGNIDRKNRFATGEVSREAVCELLSRARGNEHSESPHHLDRKTTVHLVKRKGWYIKWYFVEPDAVFISVHLEEKEL